MAGEHAVGRVVRMHVQGVAIERQTISPQGALAELRYAAPALEGYLRRAATGSTTSQRRHAIAERALARC